MLETELVLFFASVGRPCKREEFLVVGSVFRKHVSRVFLLRVFAT